MSFLDLKNVTKIYPNGTKAVHETSLSVDEESLWFLWDLVDVENQLY